MALCVLTENDFRIFRNLGTRLDQLLSITMMTLKKQVPVCLPLIPCVEFGSHSNRRGHAAGGAFGHSRALAWWKGWLSADKTPKKLTSVLCCEWTKKGDTPWQLRACQQVCEGAWQPSAPICFAEQGCHVTSQKISPLMQPNPGCRDNSVRNIHERVPEKPTMHHSWWCFGQISVVLSKSSY